jgi:hypothetical protein
MAVGITVAVLAYMAHTYMDEDVMQGLHPAAASMLALVLVTLTVCMVAVSDDS